MSEIGIAAVALVMAIGVAGTVLPFVPGLPIVWAAALVYGLVAGFDTTGWIAFGAITVIFVVGSVVGFVLPHRRAGRAGAPTSTILIGLVAGVIGFFVIPVVGLPVGAVAGVYLAERARTGDGRTAWIATKELVVGFGLGALVQLTAGLAMVGCWVGWVLAG